MLLYQNGRTDHKKKLIGNEVSVYLKRENKDMSVFLNKP